MLALVCSHSLPFNWLRLPHSITPSCSSLATGHSLTRTGRCVSPKPHCPTESVSAVEVILADRLGSRQWKTTQNARPPYAGPFTSHNVNGRSKATHPYKTSAWRSGAHHHRSCENDHNPLNPGVHQMHLPLTVIYPGRALKGVAALQPGCRSSPTPFTTEVTSCWPTLGFDGPLFTCTGRRLVRSDGVRVGLLS